MILAREREGERRGGSIENQSREKLRSFHRRPSPFSVAPPPRLSKGRSSAVGPRARPAPSHATRPQRRRGRKRVATPEKMTGESDATRFSGRLWGFSPTPLGALPFPPSFALCAPCAEPRALRWRTCRRACGGRPSAGRRCRSWTRARCCRAAHAARPPRRSASSPPPRPLPLPLPLHRRRLPPWAAAARRGAACRGPASPRRRGRRCLR